MNDRARVTAPARPWWAHRMGGPDPQEDTGSYDERASLTHWLTGPGQAETVDDEQQIVEITGQW